MSLIKELAELYDAVIYAGYSKDPTFRMKYFRYERNTPLGKAVVRAIGQTKDPWDWGFRCNITAYREMSLEDNDDYISLE